MVTSTLQCNQPGCQACMVGIGRGVTPELALRAARRMAVVLAENGGWYVSPHGQTLDLCPAHRGSR